MMTTIEGVMHEETMTELASTTRGDNNYKSIRAKTTMNSMGEVAEVEKVRNRGDRPKLGLSPNFEHEAINCYYVKASSQPKISSFFLLGPDPIAKRNSFKCGSKYNQLRLLGCVL
ncbi:hypothetical protein PIB30_021890 [Stylosanthes scabra]|uniref:Uncharacterized protein n=1 Tax=Stylosanthes scabra TaxID=79078 RepID=A0ABU6S9B1_9FABA|nr:hypothetical protein [Stylosanthes scabra]